MAEVVRVLALVRGVGLEEYRAELESWKQEDDPADRWTDEQVEAELERASREQRFSCHVELVAELDDGERVSDDCSRGVEFGPIPAPAGWRPTPAEVEDAVRQSLDRSPQPFGRFELLSQALGRRGLEATEGSLEALPFVVELDDVARRLAGAPE